MCGQRPDYRFSDSKLSASVKHSRLFLDFPGGSDGKESAGNAGDLGSILGLGRSPGEVKGYPLQYSGLENSMVHWVTRVGHD